MISLNNSCTIDILNVIKCQNEKILELEKKNNLLINFLINKLKIKKKDNIYLFKDITNIEDISSLISDYNSEDNIDDDILD